VSPLLHAVAEQLTKALMSRAFRGNAFCPKRGSDDLMRKLDGVCEFGYEWIMEHIVEAEGEHVDVEERYRDLQCYPEVKFGELMYSPSLVLESVDPTAFRIGVPTA
jgi:hypothetical protein